jgi:hypothetical protein
VQFVLLIRRISQRAAYDSRVNAIFNVDDSCIHDVTVAFCQQQFAIRFLVLCRTKILPGRFSECHDRGKLAMMIRFASVIFLVHATASATSGPQRDEDKVTLQSTGTSARVASE